MYKSYPIVIVEDDKDDLDLLLLVFHEIGVINHFKCFSTAIEAIKYLKSTDETPFLIISDINLPKVDGLAFKKSINQDTVLSGKRIPFVFLSTSKENDLMNKAFALSIQGYFQKPDDVASLKEIARAIVEYWKHSTFRHVTDLNN